MAAEKHCCAAEFWVYIMIIFLLVLFAGLMSGLTLGLMSLSLVDLEVIAKSGQAQDRKHAAKILPVVRKQHLLLCTLLICNAVAMEALPIFLDSLVSAWGAILISVTLILIFGEILPQSVCSRYGLAVGAIVAPAVHVLVWICFPIAFPISKLLDYLLGDKHVALFRRAELQTLVTMHGNEAGKGGELSHDETTIISGALELTGKTVLHAMTPICETFSIGVNEKLDREKMALILEKGHSRIPVYYEQPTNIIGLILVKNLLALHLADEVVVKDVIIRKIPRVPTNMPLYDILNEFQKGHSHMAVVVRLIEEREKTTKRSMDVKLQIGIKSSNVKEVLAHGEDVRLDVDNNSPQVVQDIPFSNKNLLYAWKNFPILTRDLSKGKSRSKKWTRVMSEDILEICDPVVPTFASENEEVVGIITLEDVIEEILQEEIFDETDAYDDTNCK